MKLPPPGLHVRAYIPHFGVVEIPSSFFQKENIFVYLSPDNLHFDNSLDIYRYLTPNSEISYFVKINNVFCPLFGLFQRNTCRVFIQMGTYAQREVFFRSTLVRHQQMYHQQTTEQEDNIVFNNLLIGEINRVKQEDSLLDTYSTNVGEIPPYTIQTIWN